MCIEKMIDEMSDACYLGHYCFRHRLHSCSLAARFLRIATCHTSSLSLPQCQVMNQKKLSKKSFFDSSVFNIYSHFLPCVLRADEI